MPSDPVLPSSSIEALLHIELEGTAMFNQQFRSQLAQALDASRAATDPPEGVQ